MGRWKLFGAGGLVCVNDPGALRSELAPLCFPVSSCEWDGQTAGQADRSPTQGDGKDTNEHPPAARCVLYFSTVPRDKRGWPGAWELGESPGDYEMHPSVPILHSPGKPPAPPGDRSCAHRSPPLHVTVGHLGTHWGNPANGRDGDNGHCCPRRPVGLWGLGGGRWHLQPGPEWLQEVTWETSVLRVGAAPTAHAATEKGGGWRVDPGQAGTEPRVPGSHPGGCTRARGDSPQAPLVGR